MIRSLLPTFGTDTHLILSVVLEETLDSTAGELQIGVSDVSEDDTR